MPERVFSIGEVARRAGLSVQSLRHYHKLGLLFPSHVSEAGYRFYSELDCLRLELIRTLRDVGFDLEVIGQLLEDKKDAQTAVMMQLETLELQLHTLKRQQVLLKTVLSGEVAAILPRLQRLNVLARLNKLEREAFLAEQLDWKPEDATHSQSRAVWEAAVLNLPTIMTEAQLEDWLELAEIAASERLQLSLQRQKQLFVGLTETQRLEWTKHLGRMMKKAMRAVSDKQDIKHRKSQKLVNEWIEGLAGIWGKKADATFLPWLYQQLSETHDPCIARYWELIARLKGTGYSPLYGQAYTWLLEGFRQKLTPT